MNSILMERITNEMILANVNQINEVIRNKGGSRWFTEISEKNPREIVEVCRARYVRMYYEEVNQLFELRWRNMRGAGECPWVIDL